MKLKFVFSAAAVLACFFVLSGFLKSPKKDPWTAQQLMPPAELAQKINSGQMENTFVFNIGPSGAIKNSIEIGSTEEDENLAALRVRLEDLPNSAEVVIYCGCCPFKNCPNVRPAFELLNEMKFSSAKLL